MILEAASAIGGIIAVAYLSTIGSILWWMLHVPKVGNVAQHANRINRESTRFARIVVPIQGDVVSDRLVALASQMAKFRGATMDVVYIIEVPLQLPLDAVSEDQLGAADDAFARAAKIAGRYDVKISKHVQRARQAGPSIVEYARATNTDLLLMGDVPKSNHRGTRYARSVEYVFENAPCEVIIDRPPVE
ncbi:MAG TPA: universal stress protein [Chloroflexota bacterium]|nr:universal stress protein [Chloroflexota bacterium]